MCSRNCFCQKRTWQQMGSRRCNLAVCDCLGCCMDRACDWNGNLGASWGEPVGDGVNGFFACKKAINPVPNRLSPTCSPTYRYCLRFSKIHLYAFAYICTPSIVYSSFKFPFASVNPLFTSIYV